MVVVVAEENDRNVKEMWNVKEQNGRTVSKNLCFLPSWFKFDLIKMRIALQESVNRNWNNLLDLCWGSK